MVVRQLLTNVILFLIGNLGVLLNRRNIFIVLMCIEIILLSVNLNFIVLSVYLDDILGQMFSIYVLTLAASESALGLAIVILFFRIKSKIGINEVSLLKK
jgi:NADH-quinone oxidoreductase subunit K